MREKTLVVLHSEQQPPHEQQMQTDTHNLHIPELVETLQRLQQQQAALTNAVQLLQAQIDDLRRNWSTRDEAFWEQTLETLHAIREVLSPWSLWLRPAVNTATGLPLPHLVLLNPIRHELLFRIEHTEQIIDEAGIAVTAYQPMCHSLREAPLQMRHHITQKLWELGKSVQHILDLSGPQGQQRCRNAYRFEE